MPTLHSWDCRCGTRNAPALDRCRICGEVRLSDEWTKSYQNSPIGRDLLYAVLLLAILAVPILFLCLWAAFSG
jgi:hypothetical protein